MGRLATKAIARMGKANGSKGKGESKGSPNPFKEAAREAWDAMKEDDFDGFSDAFESAVKIHSLGDMDYDN